MPHLLSTSCQATGIPSFSYFPACWCRPMGKCLCCITWRRKAWLWLSILSFSLSFFLSLSPSPSLPLTKLSLCYCYAFPSLFNWLSFSPDGICRLLFYDVLKRDSTKWIKHVNLTVLQSCKKVRILKFYLQILFKYNNSWCLTWTFLIFFLNCVVEMNVKCC